MAFKGTIFFVNRFFYPDLAATSQLLSDLVFDLTAKGHRVEVITGRQDYADSSVTLPAQEEINGVMVHRVWTSRFGRANLAGRSIDYLTFYLSAAWRLLLHVRPGDLIVAKTDPPLISVIAAAAARVRRAVLVNWIQDLFPEVAAALGVKAVGPFAPVLRSLRNWSLKVARCNVVLGTRMATQLAGLGVRENSVTIVHNWADEDAVRPVSRNANVLRAEWGISDKFVVGYSGNMGRVHEFETIISAAELLKDDPRIVFLFIGGGIGRAFIEHEVARRGLDQVILLPYQPQEWLSMSLSAAEVHLISLQPALEGLVVPSKFYGVAAAGRPTIYIGDPSGEIPTILQREGCGLTVQPGDAKELAHRIRELAESPDTLKSLGNKARAALERKYSKSQALALWRQTIDRMS